VWYPSWVTFVNYSTLLILKWKPFFKLILIFHFILSLPLKRLIFTITISWWSKSNNLNVLEIVNFLFIVFVMHLMHTIWRSFLFKSHVQRYFTKIAFPNCLFSRYIPTILMQLAKKCQFTKRFPLLLTIFIKMFFIESKWIYRIL
jgi:hypothetical protein